MMGDVFLGMAGIKGGSGEVCRTKDETLERAVLLPPNKSSSSSWSNLRKVVERTDGLTTLLPFNFATSTSPNILLVLVRRLIGVLLLASKGCGGEKSGSSDEETTFKGSG